MSLGWKRSGLGWAGAVAMLLVLVGGVRARGQTSGAGSQGTGSQGAASAVPAEETQQTTTDGVLVDQVIGVVNGDLVLESDVDEERRFAAFQPFSVPGGRFSRERAIERLVDRTLILQQLKLQPDQAVSTEEARVQVAQLRKDIPACKQLGCETEAGWEKFVRDQGFTMEELVELWRERMEVLKFVEMRFRAGISITPEEIKAYYEKTLLPEYARQRAVAPKLDVISDRVQEVLLQQQVSSLLGDWLKSLKAQGTVRMARPGEVQP